MVWWSRNVGGWEIEITGLTTCVIELKRHRSGFEAPAGGGWGGVQRRAYDATREERVAGRSPTSGGEAHATASATSMYPLRVYTWNECTTSLYIGCQAYRWSVQTDSERGD